MRPKEYIHIIAERLGTEILKFDGPILDDYCRLIHEGHTYKITSSLSVEKALHGLLFSDADSMKLEMKLRSREWNGHGFPPVGCECEFNACDRGWEKCTVMYASKYTVILHTVRNGDPEEAFTPEDLKFRPIRSESDKKRDEAVKAMVNHKNDPVDVTENRYHAIYDAIAAGKIPHIRID